jgi:hypothetical protein
MKITLETTELISFLDEVVRATDHAELRLELIDSANNPAIASNADVITTVKATNVQARKLRQGLQMLEKDPDCAEARRVSITLSK